MECTSQGGLGIVCYKSRVADLFYQDLFAIGAENIPCMGE